MKKLILIAIMAIGFPALAFNQTLQEDLTGSYDATIDSTYDKDCAIVFEAKDTIGIYFRNIYGDFFINDSNVDS